MVDRFQGSAEGPRIFILSLKAGGFGLNLTRRVLSGGFHINWRKRRTRAASERLAIGFVTAVLTRWSGPNAELLPFLDQSYAERVRYLGKPASRQVVLREKRRLAERWKERVYTIRPGSLSATCAADGTCRVKGAMSWSFSNPATHGRARGSASFEYSVINVIDEHEPLQIAAETTSAREKRSVPESPLTLVGRGLQKLVSQLRPANRSANTATRPKAPIVR